MKRWAYIVSWPVFTTYNRSLSRRDYTGPTSLTTSHNDDFTHVCELGNFFLLYHIRNYFAATLPRKKSCAKNAVLKNLYLRYREY